MEKVTPRVRYAVFTTHGETCYLCGKPVDLQSMEVEHIIPESLLEDPDRLSLVLSDYGLPSNFELNSFDNWLPSCGPCNSTKRANVFNPTAIIQLHLQRAAERASECRKLVEETVNNRTISKAINTLLRSDDEYIRNNAAEMYEFHQQHRSQKRINTPLVLKPLLNIISEHGGVKVIEGPYGIGLAPSNREIAETQRCVVCGHTAWSGARCVICGELDDF